MTHSLRAGSCTALAVLLLLLTLSTVAFAQEPPRGFAKEGGYAGFAGLLDFTLDGENFDGLTFYQEVDGEEFFILPKLDKRQMFRGILGYRGKKGALEFSYDRSSHDGVFDELTGEATIQSVNIDGRYFMLTQGRFQPHILVGAAFPWLTVKDGAFLEPDVANARFRGYGINTEAGITVYPTSQLGIAVGYSYRVFWFDRASGVTDRVYELRPRFRETSGTVVITGLYTF